MKVNLKPVKNFDEIVELFGNSEKFKERIEEYRGILAEMNKKLEGVENLEKLESSQANIAVLESNATNQYRLAQEAKKKAGVESEQIVELTRARVKEADENISSRERAVDQAETDLIEREGAVTLAITHNKEAREEIKRIESHVSSALATELKAAILLREELDAKLIKVNKLLGE